MADHFYETSAKGVVSRLRLDCTIVNPYISGPAWAGPDTTPHFVRLLQTSLYVCFWFCRHASKIIGLVWDTGTA